MSYRLHVVTTPKDPAVLATRRGIVHCLNLIAAFLSCRHLGICRKPASKNDKLLHQGVHLASGRRWPRPIMQPPPITELLRPCCRSTGSRVTPSNSLSSIVLGCGEKRLPYLGITKIYVAVTVSSKDRRCSQLQATVNRFPQCSTWPKQHVAAGFTKRSVYPLEHVAMSEQGPRHA
jgi:hypothetical protein